jgi:hypothetical protein
MHAPAHVKSVRVSCRPPAWSFFSQVSCEQESVIVPSPLSIRMQGVAVGVGVLAAHADPSQEAPATIGHPPQLPSIGAAQLASHWQQSSAAGVWVGGGFAMPRTARTALLVCCLVWICSDPSAKSTVHTLSTSNRVDDQ